MTNEELNQLDRELQELRTLYDNYFSGIERREPLRQREAFVAKIRRMTTGQQSGNTQVLFRWNNFKARFATLETHWNRIAKQIEMLKADPDNATANFSVGWYLCMVKDNWQQGVDMLAKAQDRALRELALLEIQQDGNLGRHLALADGWWDYAQEHQDDTLIFEAAMQRSRKWYLSVSAGLPDGIDRVQRATGRFRGTRLRLLGNQRRHD